MKHVIGFTGTRYGMTDAQKIGFKAQLERFNNFGSQIFHHGGCIGADEDAHYIANDMGFMIYVHPSNIEGTQAQLREGTFIVIYDEKPPLERNVDIVRACDVLIATPGQKQEVVRSGTWHTIRQARKCWKNHIIIYPDGSGTNTEVIT